MVLKEVLAKLRRDKNVMFLHPSTPYHRQAFSRAEGETNFFAHVTTLYIILSGICSVKYFFETNLERAQLKYCSTTLRPAKKLLL